MGGSDQWGNITTGTELIRRICQGEAFALTCPLITKADGGKFGKTEDGNVWLDPERTSPYKFYQFWLNISDEDAEKYIRIFTLLQQQEIEELTAAHRNEPHLRLLQKKLAEQITCMVHSTEEYNTAVAASEILFGKGTADQLASLDEKTLLAVFEGVPVFEMAKSDFENGIVLMQLLTENAPVFPSKGELRRSIQGNGLSINKQKYTDVNGIIHVDSLISGKFIVVQKGKKDYYLIVAK